MILIAPSHYNKNTLITFSHISSYYSDAFFFLPQEIVNTVDNWFIKNKMFVKNLNSSKCKIMSICNGHFNNPIAPISLNNQVLESVDTYKYLDIELNSQLNWDKQWANVKSNTRSLCFLLKKLRRLCFKESILKTIYKSLGLSHFIYSAPLLVSTSKSAKSEISSFHRKIERIIGTKSLMIHEIHLLMDNANRKLTVINIQFLIHIPTSTNNYPYSNQNSMITST